MHPILKEGWLQIVLKVYPAYWKIIENVYTKENNDPWKKVSSTTQPKMKSLLNLDF